MKKDALLQSFKRSDTPQLAANPIVTALTPPKHDEKPAPIPEEKPVLAIHPPTAFSQLKRGNPRSGGTATVGRYTSYDDDKKALLELRIYLSSQGVKVNDSKLVRALICTIKPSEELVRNYRIRESDDKRYKKK